MANERPPFLELNRYDFDLILYVCLSKMYFAQRELIGYRVEGNLRQQLPLNETRFISDMGIMRLILKSFLEIVTSSERLLLTSRVRSSKSV